MNLRFAFRNLFRNKRRTFGILLTIGLGAGALFAFQGFIHGMLLDYKKITIHSHYGHGQIFPKGYREEAHQAPWHHWIGNVDELEAFLNKQKEIEYVFPRINFSAFLKKGDVTVGGQGQGIEAEKESKFFEDIKIEEGKMLRNQEKGIVLGKGLAKALKVEPEDTLLLQVVSTDGETNEEEFEVVGIFKTGAQDFDNRIFRIQLPQAQELLKTEKIELVSLGLKDDKGWKRVSREIDGHFPDLETVPFNVLDEVYYQHSVNWLNAQFYIIQIIIVVIVLLGIMNTVSTSILERKQEIGNLRANGESIFNIMKLILYEGAIMGALGSLLGIALTYLVVVLFIDRVFLMPPGPGLTRDVFVTFAFTPKMVLFTFFLGLVSAIIASLFAGIKVARMPISSALRAPR